MKKYIVKIKGHQYKVQKGAVISVDRLEEKEDSTVEFKEVLMVSDGKDTKVGTPLVEGEKVKAKIKRHYKGPKIEIIKFKKKNRYMKRAGHRQEYSEIEIL